MANTTTRRQNPAPHVPNGHPVVDDAYPLPPGTSAASARRCSRSCCALETLRRVGASSRCSPSTSRRLRGDLHGAVLKAVSARRLGLARLLRGGQEPVAFAFLVTALLFARSGLYAERAERPGLPRIVASLFQVTVVALLYAVVNGEQFSSYYIFYGTLFFAVVYVGSFRWAYERVTGVLLRAAGYRRRAVLVGTGHHIEAVAHALVDEATRPSRSSASSR